MIPTVTIDTKGHPLHVLHRFSASSLPRIFACPASAILPAHGSESAAASRGTVVHKFLERVNRGRATGQAWALARDEALAETPQEYLALCSLLDVEGILSTMPLHKGALVAASEVTLAFDPATGEGMRQPPEPLDRTRLIPGRADLLAMVGPSKVYGGDFKTGRYRGRAYENWQFRFLSLAFARAAGADEAVFEAIYVDPVTGESWRDRAEFDIIDLDRFAEELRELVAKVEDFARRYAMGERLPVREGEHCTYCPAFTACSAKKDLALLVSRGDGIEKELPSLELTNEDARAVFEKIQLVKKVVARVETVIYAMAVREPIPLGNGLVLGEREKLGKRQLDGKKAHAVIAEHFGRAIADAAVELEASQKGMREALRASPLMKITAAMAFVMKELEARNGISRKKNRVVEVYDASKTAQLTEGEE
jgi:hypothetical protein